jgi:DNA-binding winged helix-turn-helix (wHTH) protein
MPSMRFGEFELDEQTLELRNSGAPVRLQQQPGRVLALLLKHRGALVTREQIRIVIWGKDTFVDFERGLNFCIRQIRLALNDSAENPAYIETLPRLGYRFVAKVEERRAPVYVPENGNFRQLRQRLSSRRNVRLNRQKLSRLYFFWRLANRSLPHGWPSQQSSLPLLSSLRII